MSKIILEQLANSQYIFFCEKNRKNKKLYEIEMCTYKIRVVVFFAVSVSIESIFIFFNGIIIHSKY